MAASVDMSVEEKPKAGVAQLYRMVTPEHICPFGFISLSENLGMMAMAIWMFVKAAVS